MRNAAKLLAVGLVLMFGGLNARATMVITGDRRDGTGLLAGWDVYHVFVTNDGVGTAASGANGNNVVGWDITINNPIGVPAVTPANSPQPFWFYRNGSLVPDPKGTTMAAIDTGLYDGTGNTSTTNRGTGSFISLFGPGIPDLGPGGVGITQIYEPSQAIFPAGTGNSPTLFNNATYAATKTFRVTGSYTFSAGNGNANDRLLGTVRLGNVIVPKNAGFTLNGTIGNSSAQSFPVAATFGTVDVPEPASLGLVGLGMLALGRRRRQA